MASNAFQFKVENTTEGWAKIAELRKEVNARPKRTTNSLWDKIDIKDRVSVRGRLGKKNPHAYKYANRRGAINISPAHAAYLSVYIHEKRTWIFAH